MGGKEGKGRVGDSLLLCFSDLWSLVCRIIIVGQKRVEKERGNDACRVDQVESMERKKTYFFPKLSLTGLKNATGRRMDVEVDVCG